MFRVPFLHCLHHYVASPFRVVAHVFAKGFHLSALFLVFSSESSYGFRYLFLHCFGCMFGVPQLPSGESPRQASLADPASASPTSIVHGILSALDRCSSA